MDTPSEAAAGVRSLYHRALELIHAQVEERTWQAFWRVVVEDRRPADVAAELGLSVNAVYLARSRVLRTPRAGWATWTEVAASSVANDPASGGACPRRPDRRDQPGGSLDRSRKCSEIPMKCPEPARLFTYLLGKLSQARMEEIARHLDDCASCAAALQGLDDRYDDLVAVLRIGWITGADAERRGRREMENGHAAKMADQGVADGVDVGIGSDHDAAGGLCRVSDDLSDRDEQPVLIHQQGDGGPNFGVNDRNEGFPRQGQGLFRGLGRNDARGSFTLAACSSSRARFTGRRFEEGEGIYACSVSHWNGTPSSRSFRATGVRTSHSSSR